MVVAGGRVRRRLPRYVRADICLVRPARFINNYMKFNNKQTSKRAWLIILGCERRLQKRSWMEYDASWIDSRRRWQRKLLSTCWMNCRYLKLLQTLYNSTAAHNNTNKSELCRTHSCQKQNSLTRETCGFYELQCSLLITDCKTLLHMLTDKNRSHKHILLFF